MSEDVKTEEGLQQGVQKVVSANYDPVSPHSQEKIIDQR